MVPDNGNNMNNAWPWLYANNNNGLLGGAGGWGAGILGFLIGTLFNGGWGNGFGFGGNGGNGAAAASLGAQATAYNNADLIMQAVTSQGEQSRQAVQTLSNALGQDFNLVNGAINTIQTSLATIAANQGMNALQVINAIQSGDANLASQFSNCCCQTQKAIMEQGYQGQIATLNQTNALGNAINANGQRNVDAIADLKSTMIEQFCAQKEREMQAKIDTQADIITQLRSAADNAAQTNQIAAMLAPMQAKLVEIESRQPSTVPVTYPNITAVNNTPYMGGYYGNGFGNIVF